MSENIKYIQVILPLDKATFVLFKNHDEKEWLIPLKNMKIGLEIYEPSAIKGKILKKGLPLLTWLGQSKNLGQFDFCRVELVGALKDYWIHSFRIMNFRFSEEHLPRIKKLQFKFLEIRKFLDIAKSEHQKGRMICLYTKKTF